ncbi:hypothetical protein [Pseudomonas sp. fls2-241-TYG-175]|uniref:hypothetical protein n=1 Tax=Pseudomonas sp. fls2-241-TYG-175 TaxID=3040312 RepID=UPI0025579151|nr:hypothetical protein [Pseudomonas sp. fls2-241-TYG-175]
MHKIKLNLLNEEFAGRQFALLIGLGFDQRSLCAVENLAKDLPQKTIGILNPVRAGTPQTNYHEDFISKTKETRELIGLNSHSLINTIDRLQEEIQNLKVLKLDIILDITSLSHELLVAIIGLLASENLFKKTTIIYTTASEYSYNTDNNSKWLSRGISDIRSILGFPGMMLPSRKLHLIIMAGFESDRAMEVISRYEPARLSIGYGSRKDSVLLEHHNTNREFAKNIFNYVIENELVDDSPLQFEFSCNNPLTTKKILINHINSFPNDNIIICALNNKISTIGAALAALENPKIQICYAQPQEYNILGYVKPGDEVTIIDLPVDADFY